MANILFLVTGDLSFDEMSYLDMFFNQLPTKSLQHLLIAPSLAISCLNPRQNLRLQIADGYFNQTKWQAIIERFNPDLAILLDPVYPLSSDAGKCTYFELEWLNDLECPLAIMDFQEDNVFTLTNDGCLVLTEYVDDEDAPNIIPDAIIRVCPPQEAIVQSPERTTPIFNWGFVDNVTGLAEQVLRAETKAELACPDDTKIITLKFPLEAMILAPEQNHSQHFRTVVEILIHYLNQFEDEQFQLYVINMPNVFTADQYDNVTLRVFEVLQLELQNRLISSSELFFTQSTTQPALIQSSFKNIPSIVLGNSVDYSAGELTYSIKEMSPFIKLKLAQIKEENPEILFPYLSYPHRTTLDWEEIKKISLFTSSFFFCLVDIFDEARTLPFLKKLYNQQSDARQYIDKDVLRYKRTKLENTRDAGYIVKRLLELSQFGI